VAHVAIDGIVQDGRPDELLIDLINRDLINRVGGTVPHVCCHPQLGPVQTCDTCMVEENGRLIRACATPVADGMIISTKSAKAAADQVEAFDRILSNHTLYCTVCDNNNGNCTVYNTTKLLAIEHQRIPFRSKPYEVDNTNPFYRGLLRRLSSKDSLRGLAAAVDFLQASGRHLHQDQSAPPSTIRERRENR
jgi:formate dehydrogenase major subunit